MLSDHTGQRVPLLRWCSTLALVISRGPVGARRHLVDCGRAAAHVHPHQRHDADERGCHGPLVSQEGSFDARRYGRVRLWGSLGFLVTVFAAGAWFEQFGMADFQAGRWPPWWRWWPAPGSCPPGGAAFFQHQSWRQACHGPVLRRPQVRWFSHRLAFTCWPTLQVYVFFSLYLDALGYRKSTIGVLWAVSVVVEIAWFFTRGAGCLAGL